jgi:hypothetical protein
MSGGRAIGGVHGENTGLQDLTPFFSPGVVLSEDGFKPIAHCFHRAGFV